MLTGYDLCFPRYLRRIVKRSVDFVAVCRRQDIAHLFVFVSGANRKIFQRDDGRAHEK